MIHGEKDESVPPVFSKIFLKLLKMLKKKLLIIKKGIHSLSKTKWLKIIKKRDKINYLTNFLNI